MADETINPQEQSPNDGDLLKDEDRLLATLCYVPILSVLLIPVAIYRKNKSEFCMKHATQALGLVGIWFITVFVSSGISIVLPTLGFLVLLMVIGLCFYGGLNAWQGKTVEIPFVTQFGSVLFNAIEPMIVAQKKKSEGESTPTETPDDGSTQSKDQSDQQNQ